MEKISGVYKITNTVTGDFYIGSSKDVKRRWREHKLPSRWKKCPNNPMYNDMKKYGLDKFAFEIIAEVEAAFLKEAEQKFIETLKPSYNDRNANGLDIERHNEAQRKASRKYEKTDKRKKYMKEYEKSNKRKESHNKYKNQLCFYNNETLTLHALSQRFKRRGIEHPTAEAKKYLIKN